MDAIAEADEAIFATETMAELYARQGRSADAVAIFSRLIQKDPNALAAARWAQRLTELKVGGLVTVSPAKARPQPASEAAATAQPAEQRMPLVIRQTIRSGQIVYAQATDLIVLAAVNPGAQLLADGNIHVYAPLRGRAIAGVRGEREARIYCQRLEAELVGIDTAYLTAEDLPRAYLRKSAQVSLDVDRCVVTSL
jgi:septum site-determining protein MinC